MKNIISILALLMFIFILTGCTGNAVYMKTDKAFAPTDAKSIQIYSVTNPSSNYEVIGYVSTYSSDAARAGDELKSNLRKQAAKYGANAIIGFKLNTSVSGGGGAQGVAVRYVP